VAENMPSIRGGALKWADVVRVASPNRLRGVSARVVAVLGFDDDAFRGRNSSGDDILASDPRVGERDLRADERLGLLTTIHSSREHLVITCNGHDVNKNTVIPLTVLMEELKDAIALAISTIPTASRSNKPVIINHSRQLADRANVALNPDASEKNVQSLIGEGNAWTFDHAAVGVVAQIANLAITGGQDGSEFGYPVLPPPIEKEIRTEVELKDFHEAIRRPVDVYINQRLGIVLPGDDEASEDEIPLWKKSIQIEESITRLRNKLKSTLSSFMIENLILNALLPFLYRYSISNSQEIEISTIISAYSKLPAENNTVTRKWNKIGINLKNAYESQASLEIYQQFCLLKKCASCEVGKNIMKK
jgi:exonuclease V gamma subunit